MKWKSGRRSENVDDRRGLGGGGVGLKGGGIGVAVVALIAMYFGVDPSVILQSVLQQSLPGAASGRVPTPEENTLADFVSVVLADTEDTWSAVFAAAGRQYEKPVLVLFSGAVDSACGYAQAAVGPYLLPRRS